VPTDDAFGSGGETVTVLTPDAIAFVTALETTDLMTTKTALPATFSSRDFGSPDATTADALDSTVTASVATASTTVASFSTASTAVASSATDSTTIGVTSDDSTTDFPTTSAPTFDSATTGASTTDDNIAIVETTSIPASTDVSTSEFSNGIFYLSFFCLNYF